MAFPDTFVRDFRARKPLYGPFVRMAGHITTEILSGVGFDCVCVDMEHSPLSRMDVDGLISGFHARNTPVIVRPRTASHEHILAALDADAAAVMAPHINTGEQAEALANAATYFRGRGYAGATRAALYGARSMGDTIARANAQAIVIAQVEHIDAVANIDVIVGVEGLDCIFIGRSDLTVSTGGTDTNAPEVVEAVDLVTRKAVEAGKVVGTFTGNLDELPNLQDQGISFFLLGSDYGMLRAGASAFKAKVDAKLN